MSGPGRPPDLVVRKGAGGEIQLTDGIARLLHTEGVLALRYEGTRYDCGSREGYIQANIEMAMRDPSLAQVVRQALASVGSAGLPAAAQV